MFKASKEVLDGLATRRPQTGDDKTAHGRFTRAIQQRNLWGAETSLRELGATFLTLAESQLVVAALASLCAGERDSVDVLRRLLRRVKPTAAPRSS